MDLPKFDFFWQYVEHWASVDPNFPTIKFNNKIITAGELYEKVKQLAKAFLSFGLKRGDRIVTVLPCSPEYIITFCAASMTGGILTPMDIRYRPADYQRFITHVEPKIIVLIGEMRGYDILKTVKDVCLNACPEAKIITVGSTEFGEPFEEVLTKKYDLDDELEKAQASLNQDDGALIIFTGGTTGMPKAALLSQGNLLYSIYYETQAMIHYLEILEIPQRIKMLSNLPPSHVGGTEETIGCPLCGGMQLISQETWSPYPVLEAIQKEKIKFFGGVPTMMAILLSLPDLEKYDLSSIKLILVSGEKLSLELLQGIQAKFSKNIINGYGSTEGGAETTFTSIGDPIEKLADGYAGFPLPEQEIKIVDDDGNELPRGKEGEILVRGPMTIKSYYKMPEEDKAGFTADGWCKMGDLGYISEDGGLYIKGRKKFIIRVGSYTVLPTEIEDIVLQDPTVAMAAAIGIPDKIYGEQIWLYVVPEVGKKPEENKIIELCKKQLADFKVPKKVFIKESLPLTRLEKTDRVALRKQVLSEMK